MASQTSSKNGSNVEVIDLTNETAVHEQTITLDDSILSDDENANYAWDTFAPNLPTVLEQDVSVSSSSSSSLPSRLPSSLSLPGNSQQKSPHPASDSPMPSPISSTPPRSPIQASQCPMPSPISSTPPRSPMQRFQSPMPSPISSTPPRSPFQAPHSLMPSPISSPSPEIPKAREPSTKGNKKSSPKIDKKTREENKRLKLKQKEEEKLVRNANRANAANKALDNCTANIDKNILQIINDSDEESIKTLFDESMINYRLEEDPKIENSITWTYKRTEVINNACVAKYHNAPWIIVVMEGKEYLKRLLAFKTNADSYDSIKTYLSELRRRTEFDVILLVYNLSTHMKNERAKEAKNYRKTFKDRFEGSRGGTDEAQDDASSITLIGITELQELRLMLEMEFKRSHSKWKMHIEFYERKIDIVQNLVKFTTSIARLEVKQKARASTGLDWAINMDKDRAVDPTKSSEDLTRLWINQLKQFAQITLPIAKSIATEYPSPCALLDQYKTLSITEGEGLLAELYVQRNLKKKIGMNISKRIHCFMTCDDPDVHIGLS